MSIINVRLFLSMVISLGVQNYSSLIIIGSPTLISFSWFLIWIYVITWMKTATHWLDFDVDNALNRSISCCSRIWLFKWLCLICLVKWWCLTSYCSPVLSCKDMIVQVIKLDVFVQLMVYGKLFIKWLCLEIKLFEPIYDDRKIYNPVVCLMMEFIMKTYFKPYQNKFQGSLQSALSYPFQDFL